MHYLLVIAFVLANQAFAANAEIIPPGPSPTPFVHPDSSGQLARATFSNAEQKAFFSGYITGVEFCEKFASVTSKENGFYVDVPISYLNPQGPHTKIWTFLTSGKFDPTKSTVIFFDGGPGGNAHGSGRLLKNFNEVHFDQRGLGCSHPAKLTDYRDPNFYSNVNNARDAEQIRKSLGAKQVGVFGASYGTVPATIYASLFSSTTSGVVLDGTLYSVDMGLQYGVIGYYLRKTYAKLPSATKMAMLTYFNARDLSHGLFNFARMSMYRNDGLLTLEKFLRGTFASPSQIDIARANEQFRGDVVDNTFFNDSLSAIESVNNLMLVCRMSEHGKTYPVPLFGNYEGQTHEFDFDLKGEDETGGCSSINAKEELPLYEARQYPIYAPVSYFQGTWDGFTFAPGAVKHFKTVPRGTKQLFIAKQGGHGVATRQLIDADHPTLQSAMIVAIEDALKGKMATDRTVKALNGDDKAPRWVRTSRN